MTVISLRDYAKEKNVSYEAIRKQVVRYREELGTHIIVDGRQQFLDEYAVAFLDEKRKKNPIMIYQQSKDETINAQQEEIRRLQAKVTEQAEQLVDLTNFKLETNEKQRLIEAAQKEQEERQQALDLREQSMNQEIQEARQAAYESAFNAAQEEFDKVATAAAKEAAGKIAAAEAAQKEAEDKLHLQEQSEAGKDRRIAELENLSPWEAFWIQFRKWMKGELNNGSEERSPAGDDTP